MPFSIQTRYGYEATFDTTDIDEIEAVIDSLFHSLRNEEFDEPDDEHTAVSLANGDLFIDIAVFGRVTLGDLSWVSTGKEIPDRKDAEILSEDLLEETSLSPLIPAGAGFRELRDAGPLLDADAGAMLAYARAITYWHARHRHCGDCGAATRVAEGGHLRVCGDRACGQKHFPRTDPAIIVLVLHRSGSVERCLLGRQAGWPETLFSAVAGFVEPGESLEDAVVREVAEETGITVTAAHYHSSQPWPFPSAIMLGFTATAAGDVILRHDQELAEARWFSRGDIVAGLRDRSLRVARRVSIAYRLLEDWFDAGDRGPLAGYLPE